MECPHWKGTVGCNPKTRGLYYSQILGLPVWLHEPQGTVSILNGIIYHVLLCNVLFSLTNSGSQSGVKLLDCRWDHFLLCYVFVLSTVSALPSRVNLTRFLNYFFQKEFKWAPPHWFCGERSSLQTKKSKTSIRLIQSTNINFCFSNVHLHNIFFCCCNSLESWLNVCSKTCPLLFLIITKTSQAIRVYLVRRQVHACS